jgi:hypothetical protein
MSDLSSQTSITGDYLRVALQAGSGKLMHGPVVARAVRGALLLTLPSREGSSIQPTGYSSTRPRRVGRSLTRCSKT